ncbi:MAG: hypothetical protein AB7N70_37095 [Dehalococcoidia bacterium]
MNELQTFGDAEARRFLTLAISSSLRPSSRWLAGSIKPQIDPDRDPPPIEGNLLRAARALAKDCLLEAPVKDAPAAEVIHGDARSLPLADSVVDAVVTSPPYFTTYDYFDVHRLTYLAFGWPALKSRQVGRKFFISRDGDGFKPPYGFKNWYSRSLGGEHRFEGRAFRAYVQDVRSVLAECYRVLRQGGVIRVAIANSIYKGRPLALDALFSEAMRELGFKNIEIRRRASEGRRILPAGRDPETGKFWSEPTTFVQEQILCATR